jgi:hypothetical protein
MGIAVRAQRGAGSRWTFLRRVAAGRALVASRSMSSQGAAGRVVEHGCRIGGNQLALIPDAAEPHVQVLGGVLRGEGLDAQPGVQARVEAAVVAARQAAVQLGQSHQYQREQGL